MSLALAADERTISRRTVLVPNGVDTALYRPEHMCGPAGALVRNLPSPILMYTGTVSYTVDPTLSGRLTDAFPHSTVVLLGPVGRIDDLATLAALRAAECRFLGKRPARDLPALLGHVDVALIPFVPEPCFVRAAQPLKTFESP